MQFIIFFLAVLVQVVLPKMAFAAVNPPLCQCLNTKCMVDEFHLNDPRATQVLGQLERASLDILPVAWQSTVQQCMSDVRRKSNLLGQIRQTRVRLHAQGLYREQKEVLLATQQQELRDLDRRILEVARGPLGSFGRQIPFIVLVVSERDAAMPATHLRLVPQCSEHDTFAAQVSASVTPSTFFSTLSHLFQSFDEVSLGGQSNQRYYRISGGRVALRVLDSRQQNNGHWTWAVHRASWQLDGNSYLSVRGMLPQRYMFQWCFQMASSGIDVNWVGAPGVSTIPLRESAPAPVIHRQTTPELPVAMPSVAAVTFESNADAYCAVHGEEERCLERAFNADADAFCGAHDGHALCADLNFQRQGRAYCTNNPEYYICRMVQQVLNPEAFCNSPQNAQSIECQYQRFKNGREAFCRREPDFNLCFHVNENRFCSVHQDDERCQMRAHGDSFCSDNPSHYLCIERDYNRNPRSYCHDHPEFWHCELDAFQADPENFCATHASDLNCQITAFLAAPRPYCNSNPSFIYCIFPELGERMIEENLMNTLRGR